MGRLGQDNGGLMVSVITGWNGTWNTGDFCARCIAQAVVDAARLECHVDLSELETQAAREPD
jgi:hypothetical protein